MVQFQSPCRLDNMCQRLDDTKSELSALLNDEVAARNQTDSEVSTNANDIDALEDRADKLEVTRVSVLGTVF